MQHTHKLKFTHIGLNIYHVCTLVIVQCSMYAVCINNIHTHHAACEHKNYNLLMISFVDIGRPILEQDRVIPNIVFYSYRSLSPLQTYLPDMHSMQSSLCHNHDVCLFIHPWVKLLFPDVVHIFETSQQHRCCANLGKLRQFLHYFRHIFYNILWTSKCSEIGQCFSAILLI